MPVHVVCNKICNSAAELHNSYILEVHHLKHPNSDAKCVEAGQACLETDFNVIILKIIYEMLRDKNTKDNEQGLEFYQLTL